MMTALIARYGYQQFFGFHRLDMGTDLLAICIDPIDLLMNNSDVAHDVQLLSAAGLG